MPYTGEMRRVMLAFESRLQEEVRFALNCLLLYSCSVNSPYYIENCPAVFDSMIQYLESVIAVLPEVFSRAQDKKSAPGFGFTLSHGIAVSQAGSNNASTSNN